MKKEELYLGKVKCDSLRIRIPADKVVDTSPISEPYMKVGIHTGNQYRSYNDVEGTFHDMTDKRENDGIKVSWKKCTIHENNPMRASMQVTDWYEIAINSKFLREGYFEGITAENLPIVYEYIQSIPDGLKFSYEDFISAQYVDVDLCYDVECDRKVFEDFKDRLYSLWNQTSERKIVCKKYSSNKKSGIQFMHRLEQTATAPYVKYYDKALELDERSSVFYKKFLGGKLPVNVVRYEVNFRDKEAWRKRLPDEVVGNLWELLAGGLERFKNYILSVVRLRFIEKRVIMRKQKDIPSPKEFIEDYLVSGSIDAGLGRGFFEIVSKQYKSVYGVTNEQAKRCDEYMQEILDRNLKDELSIRRIEHNSEVEVIGRQLGVWE
jgi:hypothetical protein